MKINKIGFFLLMLSFLPLATQALTISGTDLHSIVQESLDLNASANASTSIATQSEIIAPKIEEDKNLQSVQSIVHDDGSFDISVTYRHIGYFLGLFPVSYDTITTVTKVDGSTQFDVVSKPSFWNYLVTQDNYDHIRIENQIKNNSEIKANATLNASESSRIKIVNAIVAELKASESVSK